VAGTVQEPREAAAAILRQDADVRAVEPGALRIVMAEPIVIDRVDVPVLDVAEVDRRPEVRGAGDGLSGPRDDGQLPLGKRAMCAR